MEKEFKIIYVGERLLSNGKLSAAFVKTTVKDKDDSDKYMYFSSSKRYHIGYIYKATQTGDKMYQIGRESVGRLEDEELTDGWYKKDIAAREIRKDIIAREKVRKNPLKQGELDFLRKYTEKLSWKEKEAFVKYLIMEIMTKGRR